MTFTGDEYDDQFTDDSSHVGVSYPALCVEMFDPIVSGKSKENPEVWHPDNRQTSTAITAFPSGIVVENDETSFGESMASNIQTGREQHEDALKMALDRMKDSALNPDSEEYAMLFLKVLSKVKAEVKGRELEQDPSQDEDLGGAVPTDAATRNKACIVIQAYCRRYMIRSVFARLLEGVHKHTKVFETEKKAAICIQTCYRRHRIRRYYLDIKDGIQRNEVDHERFIKACTRIQSLFRRFRTRSIYLELIVGRICPQDDIIFEEVIVGDEHDCLTSVTTNRSEHETEGIHEEFIEEVLSLGDDEIAVIEISERDDSSGSTEYIEISDYDDDSDDDDDDLYIEISDWEEESDEEEHCEYRSSTPINFSDDGASIPKHCSDEFTSSLVITPSSKRDKSLDHAFAIRNFEDDALQLKNSVQSDSQEAEGRTEMNESRQQHEGEKTCSTDETLGTVEAERANSTNGQQFDDRARPLDFVESDESTTGSSLAIAPASMRDKSLDRFEDETLQQSKDSMQKESQEDNVQTEKDETIQEHEREEACKIDEAVVTIGVGQADSTNEQHDDPGIPLQCVSAPIAKRSVSVKAIKQKLGKLQNMIDACPKGSKKASRLEKMKFAYFQNMDDNDSKATKGVKKRQQKKKTVVKVVKKKAVPQVDDANLLGSPCTKSPSTFFEEPFTQNVNASSPDVSSSPNKNTSLPCVAECVKHSGSERSVASPRPDSSLQIGCGLKVAQKPTRKTTATPMATDYGKTTPKKVPMKRIDKGETDTKDTKLVRRNSFDFGLNSSSNSFISALQSPFGKKDRTKEKSRMNDKESKLCNKKLEPTKQSSVKKSASCVPSKEVTKVRGDSTDGLPKAPPKRRATMQGRMTSHPKCPSIPASPSPSSGSSLPPTSSKSLEKNNPPVSVPKTDGITKPPLRKRSMPSIFSPSSSSTQKRVQAVPSMIPLGGKKPPSRSSSTSAVNHQTENHSGSASFFKAMRSRSRERTTPSAIRESRSKSIEASRRMPSTRSKSRERPIAGRSRSREPQPREKSTERGTSRSKSRERPAAKPTTAAVNQNKERPVKKGTSGSPKKIVKNVAATPSNPKVVKKISVVKKKIARTSTPVSPKVGAATAASKSKFTGPGVTKKSSPSKRAPMKQCT